MRRLYFDGAADAPVCKESFRAMKPFLTKGWVGNAHSVHDHGIQAAMNLEEARQTVLNECGFSPREAVCAFTSGASEGNNWFVASAMSSQTTGREAVDKERNVVVGETEHESLLAPICHYAELNGYKVFKLKIDSFTHFISKTSAEDVIAQMAKEGRHCVCLLALSPINNEIGVRNDANGVYTAFEEAAIPIAHSLLDCTQALSCGGSTLALGKDFPKWEGFVFGGHKIGGPEGIGALIIRGEAADLPAPLIFGGSQEYGHRAGTSNVAGAVAMAAALRALGSDEGLYIRMAALREQLLNGLSALDENLKVNGFGSPNILNITFSDDFLKNLINTHIGDWSGDALTQSLSIQFGIEVSAGAACSAGEATPRPSAVMLAMGKSDDEIGRTVRFSFTARTKASDVKECLRRIAKALRPHEIPQGSEKNDDRSAASRKEKSNV